MSRRIGSIGAYIISCSSDAEKPLGQLDVWGELDTARWFPSTAKEARMRVEACRKKMKCRECDAEIHRVIVERTRPTLLRRRREEEQRRRCE